MPGKHGEKRPYNMENRIASIKADPVTKQRILKNVDIIEAGLETLPAPKLNKVYELLQKQDARSFDAGKETGTRRAIQKFIREVEVRMAHSKGYPNRNEWADKSKVPAWWIGVLQEMLY